MEQPPVLLNNRYKILARIGTGGMASVYRAQDLALGRQVAVKVLHQSLTADPAFLRRFEREARAAANLSHPNIVTVHDVGQDGDIHYIVMEHVDGEDLKALIRRDAPLNIDYALELVIQICAGIGYAHRAGFVHCDVKPQNVLITSDGRVKVADFGIARALASVTISQHTDQVWGSPHYFSPEQAVGETLTPASDVYAIGVVLYEMLTARLPFEADNPTALALMHLREDPPLPTQFNPLIPEALEQIIVKVLSKEPAARYRTADQLGRILDTYRRQGEQATSGQVRAEATPAPALASPGTVPSAPIAPAARPAQATVASPTAASRAQTVVVVPERPGAEEEAEAAGAAGIDWLGVMLALVALLAVCGLIPLWTVVYTRYTSVPTPTPVPPTPIPALQVASGWLALLIARYFGLG